MLSNHPQTGVFLGSAIKNNAQPNKAEHYLSVCAQLYQLVIDTSHWSHWTGVINIKQALGLCTTGRNTALDRCPLYTGFVIT